jgi:PD-(D/E)XK nuclease superfamily
MPRPSSGYFNSAGAKIPGTNDIVRLWGNKRALMRWHNLQGLKGIDTEEDNSAIDIGSVVHSAIERHMRGAQKQELVYLFQERLPETAHRQAAYASFKAFLEWYEQCEVNPIEQETSLVSESLQYGGTPDLIAHVKNRVAIVDFKTSKDGTIYPESKVAIRAHANLWNEHNAAKFAVQTYHLIGLSKEGAGFKHYEFPELDNQWSLFKTLLQAHQIEKACGSVTQGRAKPVKAIAPTPKRIRVKREPALVSLTEVVEAADLANHVWRPEHQLTMAEILRAHGHVPEIRP